VFYSALHSSIVLLPVIDGREFETLVSRQETICEYRPAKAKRKTITSLGMLGRHQMDARVQ